MRNDQRQNLINVLFRNIQADLRVTGLSIILLETGANIPLELKPEFKQAVDSAIKQYRTTRLPIDPATKVTWALFIGP